MFQDNEFAHTEFLYSVFLRMAKISLCISLLLVMPTSVVHAQFYKWQDAQGNWHISDEAPSESDAAQSSSEVQQLDAPTPAIGVLPSNASPNGIGSAPAGVGQTGEAMMESFDGSVNLLQQLEARYPDMSPIARATLAVVKIKTPLGEGLGFFVTSAGHIVTNKHVIRPADSGPIAQKAAEFEARKAALAKMNRALRVERASMRDLKAEMKAKAKYIKSKSEGSVAKKVAQREYDDMQSRYKSREQDYIREQRRYRKLNETLISESSGLSFKISTTNMARRFKIFLKDGSMQWAHLLRIHERSDLALLQVRVAETPFILPSFGGLVSQGMTVFAIGSPGRGRDVINKGIVTGIQGDLVLNDISLASSNSGAPLITEWGDVVGIASARLAAENDRENGGISRHIEAIFRAFPDDLPPLPGAP
jgi:S1-C subfamily serine protease